MNGILKYFLIILVFIAGAARHLHAQNKTIDSLRTLLGKDIADTSRAILLNGLSAEYVYISSPDSAVLYASRALTKAKQLNFKKEIANAYNNLGNSHRLKGEYQIAIDFLLKALKLDEELVITNEREGKKGMAIRIGNIGLVYWDQGNNAKAIDHYLKAIKMHTEINDLTGIAKIYSNMGVLYRNQGDFSKALEYYFKALKAREELGDKKGMAKDLGRVGLVYSDQATYTKALEYFLKALKMDEEYGDKSGIGIRLGNIGSVYLQLGDYAQALTYYLRALKIVEELGATKDIAAARANIGSIYSYMGEDEKALNYFTQSLQIAEKYGYKQIQSINLGNIGIMYMNYADTALEKGKKEEAQRQFMNALDNFLKALKISEALGDKNSITSQLGTIGSLYVKTKKYHEAYSFMYRALSIDNNSGAMNNIKNDYAWLSYLYEKSEIPLPDTIGGKISNMEQMRLRSLYYYKRYISLRDTLFSEENKKELVRKEMNFEFEKKVSQAKAEQEKKDAVTAAESRKQKAVLALICCVLLLAMVVGFIISRSLRITRKQKRLIEKQKQLVEEHQQETMDSIYYARRIQLSLLPTEKYIQRVLTALKK